MDEIIYYTIMTLGTPERESKRSAIKNEMFFYNEVKDIEFVNGADEDQVRRMREKFPRFTGRPWHPKTGEVGVWYSQMNCWEWARDNNKHLIVFEDDAMLTSNFVDKYMKLLEELPSDYDFFAIFVPNNQEGDYFARGAYDHDGVPVGMNWAPADKSMFNFGASQLAKVYQGYSCVAIMYSPKGAKKLLELADEYGMYTPVDCFLFLEAHRGHLEAYSPKPSQFVERLITIDWEASSTIRDTPQIDMSIMVESQ